MLAASDFGKSTPSRISGGGNGHLPRAVLDSVPSAEGILFASPGARVLIIENVLGDVHSDRRGHTLDVIMLVVTGGRERTGEQLSTLHRGAGFTKPTVIDTAGPLSTVEAIAG